MIDRGIIKWQPFNSCFSRDNIINDINNVRNKKNLPILSEDQINIIEEKIKESYFLKLNTTIEFFYNGDIKIIKGIINSINLQEKKICLNYKNIHFKQILKIYY